MMGNPSLVPRVLRLFGQWLVARKDSGRRVSPGDQPLPKESEDSGYKIGEIPLTDSYELCKNIRPLSLTSQRNIESLRKILINIVHTGILNKQDVL